MKTSKKNTDTAQLVSKRMRLRLTPNELHELRFFCAHVGAYSTIKQNTSISYDTIQRLLGCGAAERDVVIKLRALLNQLKANGIINTEG